jgi:CMP-2-keto-3-deoxyoctulosonic acid synthetase
MRNQLDHHHSCCSSTAARRSVRSVIPWKKNNNHVQAVWSTRHIRLYGYCRLITACNSWAA